MLTLDDKHLITHTQSGDPEAFGPLVVKYHDRLYTHIYGRVKDAETAEDLTQETWLRAFRAISSFRGGSAFYSWLYRIAENVCTDHFRRQKYNTEPLHLIDENRITETDQKALTALTPIRRRVFLLYYHHERFPIKAIAAEIGRSEGEPDQNTPPQCPLAAPRVPHTLRGKSARALACMNVCVLRVSGIFGFW